MKVKQVIESGKCSYYENIKWKQNQVITVSQFINDIRSNRWKTEVETYRQLKVEGKLKEAEKVKGEMPAATIAAVYEGGHSKKNVRTLSGYLMLDIDHYPGDIHELERQVQAFPWVKGCFISISGEGMKIIIRVDCTTLEEYEKQAYPIVARHIGRLIDFPVDMACSDVSRTCYASYDPDAFLREEEGEVFPWREEVEAFQAEQEATKATGASNPKEDTSSSAQGLVQKFLDDFMKQNPYIPNHRHNFQLVLGREARRAGMKESEFEELVSLAVSQLAMPDCEGPEIRRNLMDAYRFAELNQLAPAASFGFKSPRVQPAPYPRYQQDYADQEETVAHNHEMRLQAPHFAEWIFDAIPSMLKEGLAVAHNLRERDMLTLAMLTNYSGCMPYVQLCYGDADIYTHFFTMVVGEAASGKGIMTIASQLGTPIHQMMMEENRVREQEFEKAQLRWEEERQKALKEKRSVDIQLKPEPVHCKELLVPADVSRTQLIHLLSQNENGLILNVSEMDTLHTATSAKYGCFDDLMRACFHHEMFGSNFKSDKQAYMVYCPKLAFCASGTPNQFYKLCPTVENGAYSRYLIYMAEQETSFRCMAPGGEAKNRKKVFDRLGEKTRDMYLFLQKYPTEVKFTMDQWNRHQSYFESMRNRIMLENQAELTSVVFRHGLNAARLAMILTALRKYESQWTFHEVVCSEEDFQIAMAMIDTLLQHSLTYATSLPKHMDITLEMRHNDKVKTALKSLPKKFTYTELMEAFIKTGVSLSSAKRIRERLIKIGLLTVNKKDKEYKIKPKKWKEIYQEDFRK